MDPLHPFVPIQPPPPTPPTYGRVERIQRDGQRESHPDWERDSEETADEEQQGKFEDEYDPDWTDPASAEPYGPDGTQHDTGIEVELGPEREWDPRADDERRSRPRGPADDADSGSGHIDISA
jgi:hypothetical protein